MNSKEIADVNCRSMRTCGAIPVDPLKQKGSVLNVRGFTLIELIMVSAVLAVLAAIAIPMWPRYKNMARASRAMSEIRTLEVAIAGYYADRGVQPPSLADAGYGTLLDPWGNPYQYRQAGGFRTFAATPVSPLSYDLWSNGANGASDPSGSIVTDVSADDIIRGRDGGFVGLASNY